MLPVFIMAFHFLDVIVFSIFMYYGIRPLFRRINRRITSKALAVGASVMVVAIPLALFTFYAVGIVSSQLQGLSLLLDEALFEDGNNLVATQMEALSNIRLTDVVNSLYAQDSIHPLGDTLVALAQIAVDVLLRIFLVLVTTYILLCHDSELTNWLLKKVVHRDKTLAEAFFKGVDGDLERVFHGSILTSIVVVILGIVVYTSLNLISPGTRIPYPGVTGILCGVASLIPGIGVIVVWLPMGIYLAIHTYMEGNILNHLWFVGLFFAASAVVVDFIPNWILRPKVSVKDIDDNLMLVAYIVGPLMFGLSGVLIGPILLVLIANFTKTILPELDII